LVHRNPEKVLLELSVSFAVQWIALSGVAFPHRVQLGEQGELCFSG